jgi:hypothetical protein
MATETDNGQQTQLGATYLEAKGYGVPVRKPPAAAAAGAAAAGVGEVAAAGGVQGSKGRKKVAAAAGDAAAGTGVMDASACIRLTAWNVQHLGRNHCMSHPAYGRAMLLQAQAPGLVAWHQIVLHLQHSSYMCCPLACAAAGGSAVAHGGSGNQVICALFGGFREVGLRQSKSLCNATQGWTNRVETWTTLEACRPP